MWAKIKKKKWGKILVSVIIMVKIFVLVMIIGAAHSDDSNLNDNATVKYISAAMPESITFAGEAVPLDEFDVFEALDRELLSNAYFHSQTIRYIKLTTRYFAIIEPILKAKGIPDDFKYLALAESGFNPRAVSPVFAVGLWQFMKGTAQDYGLIVNSEVDERYHVKKSTYAACNYLKDAYKRYGNWTMVAASYNAGMAGIDRQIDRQKTDSYYDLLLVEESQRYLFRILALKQILENPEKYHFYISENEKYPVIPTRIVEVNGPVESFAQFAKDNGLSYKRLKDFNPWLRDNKLTNSAGKSYEIEIPVLN
ncbi:MAG: murein transglycosylase [Draconibacterium sp.]|nr:MAG: murein transglycosylase [Draconibacterium sp.]